jgi:hypothetical protein
MVDVLLDTTRDLKRFQVPDTEPILQAAPPKLINVGVLGSSVDLVEFP